MVPEGWTYTALGHVMEFKNGLNFTKSDAGEEIKIVGVADFKDFSEIRSTDHLVTVNVSSKVREGELLEDGDLLFVRSNGNKKLIGRCLYFPSVTDKISFSGFTIRGRADKSLVIPEYIASVARSSLVKQQISRAGGGTNISNLSQQILSDIVFPLPPIGEQKKITKILSIWENTITTTEELFANSQQQKKVLMQQLLTGKRRLLDQGGERFGGEWKRVELGDLLDYKQPTPYLVKSTEYDDSYKTPVLTAGKTFILGFTDEDFGVFSEDLPAIIFDDFTTGSKFVDFPFKAKSSAMKILTAKDGVSIKYVFEAMQMIDFAVGGHQRHWISMYSRLVIPLPSNEEQQKIVTVLSAADQEITALQHKLNVLKQEKKALMQQLLTGKRKVLVQGIV